MGAIYLAVGQPVLSSKRHRPWFSRCLRLPRSQRKVKDKANPRDATPEKQPAETLEVSRRLENQGTYGVYN